MVPLVGCGGGGEVDSGVDAATLCADAVAHARRCLGEGSAGGEVFCSPEAASTIVALDCEGVVAASVGPGDSSDNGPKEDLRRPGALGAFGRRPTSYGGTSPGAFAAYTRTQRLFSGSFSSGSWFGSSTTTGSRPAYDSRGCTVAYGYLCGATGCRCVVGPSTYF
jgi:hypothetical protein